MKTNYIPIYVIDLNCIILYQVRAIIRNRTGIEDWILEKAKYRREGTHEVFPFPYDLGAWKNIKQVFYWTSTPSKDGIDWVVREGCNQFTLTVRTTFHTYRNFYKSDARESVPIPKYDYIYSRAY